MTIENFSQKERLHAFFSSYVDPTCKDSYDDDLLFSFETMRDAVELLLSEGVFSSKEDMREECLRDFKAIIPESLFGV